jgi:hypothetical protein
VEISKDKKGLLMQHFVCSIEKLPEPVDEDVLVQIGQSIRLGTISDVFLFSSLKHIS